MKPKLLLSRIESKSNAWTNQGRQTLAIVKVDGQAMKDIPKTDIAATAKEGDALKSINGKYEVDIEETKRIKDEAEKLMNDLWK
ncbi:DUF3006 domain-containing protein [Desulfosporosinus metallidurans]|nr:DUF3006 domain-containing protein [Desulfosporosinus metallidurans]